jgi:hypothetical protein
LKWLPFSGRPQKTVGFRFLVDSYTLALASGFDTFV